MILLLKEQACKNLDAVKIKFEPAVKMRIAFVDLDIKEIIANSDAEIVFYPIIHSNPDIRHMAIHGSDLKVEKLDMGLEPKITPKIMRGIYTKHRKGSIGRSGLGNRQISST